MPCKTFIPRGSLTFVFLNLEMENFNEKADRCLRTSLQSGPYITGESGALFGSKKKKEVDSCFVLGLSPTV